MTCELPALTIFAIHRDHSCLVFRFAMAARQRRHRPRQGDHVAGPTASKTGSGSRRGLLLFIFAITTAIFLAFQVSRYKNENSATGRFISSMLQPGAAKPAAVLGDTQGESKQMELKDRILAVAKQFQRELGAVVADKTSSSHQEEEVGVAVVAGEGLVNHSASSLLSTKHIPEKSAEEAAEDQQIGLEDLDQDTLKAMFDALYARG